MLTEICGLLKRCKRARCHHRMHLHIESTTSTYRIRVRKFRWINNLRHHMIKVTKASCATSSSLPALLSNSLLVPPGCHSLPALHLLFWASLFYSGHLLNTGCITNLARLSLYAAWDVTPISIISIVIVKSLPKNKKQTQKQQR